MQKEVAARGAAQEMAGLLKEQQSKLSALAESRRQLQSELQAVRSRAAEQVTAAEEAARQAAERLAAEQAACAAAVTREQLGVATAREELESAKRKLAEERAALVKAHEDAIRVKDKVLDDVSAQLTQARSAAKASELAAAQAKAERDACVHDVRSAHDDREALAASEEAIARLEGALEELEHGRAEAEAAAEEAREELKRKEQMLEFVESEVHSVTALFRDKEAAMAHDLEEKLSARDDEVQRAREALARADDERRAAQAACDAAEDAKAAAEAQWSAERLERERLAELLDAAAAEADAARADKAQVEGEMRLVLRAMDAQKQAAARNMMQLNKIAQDWSSQINSPEPIRP